MYKHSSGQFTQYWNAGQIEIKFYLFVWLSQLIKEEMDINQSHQLVSTLYSDMIEREYNILSQI